TPCQPPSSPRSSQSPHVYEDPQQANSPPQIQQTRGDPFHGRRASAMVTQRGFCRPPTNADGDQSGELGSEKRESCCARLPAPVPNSWTSCIQPRLPSSIHAAEFPHFCGENLQTPYVGVAAEGNPKPVLRTLQTRPHLPERWQFPCHTIVTIL